MQFHDNGSPPYLIYSLLVIHLFIHVPVVCCPLYAPKMGFLFSTSQCPLSQVYSLQFTVYNPLISCISRTTPAGTLQTLFFCQTSMLLLHQIALYFVYSVSVTSLLVFVSLSSNVPIRKPPGCAYVPYAIKMSVISFMTAV